MSAKEQAAGLLEALKAAGQSDLDQIRGRIAELTKELEALKAAEKLLDVRINGKPEKVKRSPAGPKLAERVYELIAKAGPGTVQQIALKLSTTPAAIGMCVARSNWFTKLDSGKICIATTGNK